MPRACASVLRSVTKADCEPATQTARVSAMLSAEGRSRARSSCRSVNCSPLATERLDPSSSTIW
jgi:hypothetical protein